MGDIRDTAAWQALRALVVAEEPLCYLQLPGCTRLSTTADHVHPIRTHPHLALERGNVRGACASCNFKKGKKALAEVLREYAMDVAPPPAMDFFS